MKVFRTFDAYWRTFEPRAECHRSVKRYMRKLWKTIKRKRDRHDRWWPEAAK